MRGTLKPETGSPPYRRGQAWRKGLTFADRSKCRLDHIASRRFGVSGREGDSNVAVSKVQRRALERGVAPYRFSPS